MRRQMTQSSSRGYFVKHALHTKSVNYFTAPMLGGYRF